MDFELSEELKMVQSLARDFVDEQLRPLEGGLIKMVKEMGLWGLGVPEGLGGAGLDTLGVCLVEEELARTVVPFNFGDVTPILFGCNADQREKFLAPALAGRKRPYLALMEPGETGDLVSLKMKASRDNGHYLLSGKKLSLSRA